jgi:FtsZ-binding cell division protein ZapB
MSSKHQEGSELEIAHLKRELAELKARLTDESSQRTVANEALSQEINALSEKARCW